MTCETMDDVKEPRDISRVKEVREIIQMPFQRRTWTNEKTASPKFSPR